MTNEWLQKLPQEKIIEWRRHFHQNPELSFEETHTAQFIYDTLQSFPGMKVQRPTPTSVVGILQGAAGAGKTIALRADIDALPVAEETGLPFKSSVDGVMHACGHDTHAAMLLGTAYVIAQMQEQLRGTVKFLFQHAEEKPPGGAAEIMRSGILDDVDYIFGLHIIPNLKTGSIGIVSGTATTSADGFFLKIQGRGSHASMPQLAVDPVMIGSQIVTALYEIVSRNVTPGEKAVLSIGEFSSGDMPNVIPDTAKISASIRTVTPATRKLMENRVRTIIDSICTMHGATYDLDYILGYGPVINDSRLCDIARAAAVKAVGEENVFESPQLPASEDFSAYTEKIKGCYFILGGGTEADGCSYANHNPKFVIVEDAMFNGTKTEIQIILDLLSQ